MIIAQNHTFVEGVKQIAPIWRLFGMTGVVPNSDSEIAFDSTTLDGILANSVCVMGVQSVVKDSTYFKFSQIKSLRNNLGAPSDITKSIPCANATSNTSYQNDFEKRLSLANGDANSLVTSGSTMKVGDYVELDFGQVTDITNVEVKHYNAAGSPTSYEIEYWDGNSWISGATYTGTLVSAVLSFALNVATNKVRIKITADKAGFWRLESFKVFANAVQSTPRSMETITWAILVPENYAAVSDVLEGEVPFMYFTVSSPNEGGDAILTNANPVAGEAVRLIHFTMGPQVIEV